MFQTIGFCLSIFGRCEKMKNYKWFRLFNSCCCGRGGLISIIPLVFASRRWSSLGEGWWRRGQRRFLLPCPARKTHFHKWENETMEMRGEGRVNSFLGGSCHWTLNKPLRSISPWLLFFMGPPLFWMGIKYTFFIYFKKWIPF